MFEARLHALRHRRGLALFCAALAIAGVGVAAEACSSSSSPDPGITPEGGDDTTEGGLVTSCPKSAPDAGTACNAPEGTTCAFGVCDGVYIVCSGGVWQQAPITPVPSQFPEGVPSAGSACPACFSADASHLYQQPCATGGSAVRASCVGSVWQLTPDTCQIDAGPDATDDAGSDGSDADAQG